MKFLFVSCVVCCVSGLFASQSAELCNDERDRYCSDPNVVYSLQDLNSSFEEMNVILNRMKTYGASYIKNAIVPHSNTDTVKVKDETMVVIGALRDCEIVIYGLESLLEECARDGYLRNFRSDLYNFVMKRLNDLETKYGENSIHRKGLTLKQAKKIDENGKKNEYYDIEGGIKDIAIGNGYNDLCNMLLYNCNISICDKYVKPYVNGVYIDSEMIAILRVCLSELSGKIRGVIQTYFDYMRIQYEPDQSMLNFKKEFYLAKNDWYGKLIDALKRLDANVAELGKTGVSLSGLKSELEETKTELDETKTELAKTKAELEEAKAKLAEQEAKKATEVKQPEPVKVSQPAKKKTYIQMMRDGSFRR